MWRSGYGIEQVALDSPVAEQLDQDADALTLARARLPRLAHSLFTNIALENRIDCGSSVWPDWRLLHRSVTELRRLWVEAGYAAGDVAVTRHATGLALVVRCAVSGVVAAHVP